jgi:hypothetical protein
MIAGRMPSISSRLRRFAGPRRPSTDSIRCGLHHQYAAQPQGSPRVDRGAPSLSPATGASCDLARLLCRALVVQGRFVPNFGRFAHRAAEQRAVRIQGGHLCREYPGVESGHM